MADENLEKKTKRAFAYGALVGLMGGLVVGLPIAFHAHNVGHNEGYDEGRKAGVAEGKEEGFAEGKEAQLKSRNAFISVQDHLHGYNGGGPLAFFSMTQPDGLHEVYAHRMFCSSEGEFFMDEKIEITSPDGNHLLVYMDEGQELTLSSEGQVISLQPYGDRLDGRIDTILHFDTIETCQFCSLVGLSRRQHYKGNEAIFDAADAKLREMREYFAPGSRDYPYIF